jgi:elongation factor G
MLKSNAVAITLIGENDFKGIVDLVKNEAIVWHDDTGRLLML